MLRPDLAGWRPQRTWRQAPAVLPIVTVRKQNPVPPPQPPPIEAPPPFRHTQHRRAPLAPEQPMDLTRSMIQEITSQAAKHHKNVSISGHANVTLLVEMHCQQGLLTMRHDKLKYDRYFERVRAEVEGLTRYSSRLQLGVIVQQMPPLTSGNRLGAFEIYMVSQLSHPPQCVGLFSKLKARRWPNIPAIAQRCEEALELILQQLSDLEIQVAEMKSRLKIHVLKWARFMQTNMDRKSNYNLAIAFYSDTGVQKLIAHAFRGFRQGLANQRRAHERMILKWRRWALLEPLKRFKVAVVISRKRRTYLREAFHELVELIAEEKLGMQSELRRMRLMKGLQHWLEAAYATRRQKTLLARVCQSWSSACAQWKRDRLAARTTTIRLHAHQRKRALVQFRRRCAVERAKGRITLRYWRAADVFRGHRERIQLLFSWSAWMTTHNELREQHRKEQQSLLRVAAKDGALSVVKGFLRAGFDVNKRDEDDYSSAIMLACLNGHEEVVKLLIEWGAEVNVAMEGGWTPLTLACENGLTRMVPLLVNCSANVDMRLATGWTALMLACARGHQETALALLKADADISVQTYDTTETALTAACRHGHTALAQLLIENGADVNAQTADHMTARTLAEDFRQRELTQLRWQADQTVRRMETSASVAAVRALLSVSSDSHAGYKALREAARDGQAEMVEALLDAGVAINERDDEDEATALMLACQNGHHPIVATLVTLGADVGATMKAKKTALEFATTEGHSGIVQSLLVGKADVNASSSSSYTPLMLACSRGHKETAATLISGRADVNAQEHDSLETPLTAACRNGHMEVAKLLMDKGADAEAKTRGGQTARQLAAQHENELLRLLRRPAEMSASVPPAEDQATPGARAAVRAVLAASGEACQQALRTAAEDGILPVVQALLSAGIAADERDENDDSTVLMAACQNGHELVVAALLDKGGANANAAMKGGWNPLMLACEGGHHRVVRELLARNAAVDTRLFNGWTAIMLAAVHGHHETLMHLFAADADVDAQVASTGETALTAACRNGYVRIARALVQRGADLRATTCDGQTALDIAQEMGNQELYSLLRDANHELRSSQTKKKVAVIPDQVRGAIMPMTIPAKQPDREAAAVAAIMAEEELLKRRRGRGWALLRARRPQPSTDADLTERESAAEAERPEADSKVAQRGKGWSVLRRSARPRN